MRAFGPSPDPDLSQTAHVLACKLSIVIAVCLEPTVSDLLDVSPDVGL